MEDKIVLLASFSLNSEAYLVKSFLESQDIPCVINDSLSNQLLGSYIDIGGVSLSVLKKDLQRAQDAMREGGFAKYLE